MEISDISAQRRQELLPKLCDLKALIHRKQVQYALRAVRQTSSMFIGIVEPERSLVVLERWLEDQATELECEAASSKCLEVVLALYGDAKRCSDTESEDYHSKMATAYAIHSLVKALEATDTSKDPATKAWIAALYATYSANVAAEAAVEVIRNMTSYYELLASTGEE